MASEFDALCGQVGDLIADVFGVTVSYTPPSATEAAAVALRSFSVDTADARQYEGSEGVATTAIAVFPSTTEPSRAGVIAYDGKNWVIDAVKSLPGGDYHALCKRYDPEHYRQPARRSWRS